MNTLTQSKPNLQESPVSTTLVTFTGLILFMLVLAVTFFVIYTFLHTGQSILGEISLPALGWPHP